MGLSWSDIAKCLCLEIVISSFIFGVVSPDFVYYQITKSTFDKCWHVNKLSTNLLTFYCWNTQSYWNWSFAFTGIISLPACLGMVGVDHRWSVLLDLLTCQQIVNKFVDIVLLNSQKHYQIWFDSYGFIFSTHMHGYDWSGPPMIRFTEFVDMSTNCQQICWHSIAKPSETLSERFWYQWYRPTTGPRA